MAESSLDANLKKLRLSGNALKLLEDSEISSFSALLDNESVVVKLRTFLNPIQQSKLSALIKEFETSDLLSESCGSVILINSEKNANRQEILQQIELEHNSLEEINSLISDELVQITSEAKELIYKYKAAHQERANLLNTILRTKPKYECAHISTTLRPQQKRKHFGTRKIRFEDPEKLRNRKFPIEYSSLYWYTFNQ